MIPPQHWQDMVPLLIQTFKKPLRDTIGGDFHSDHRHSQEKQPVMAMGTSSLQGQLGTMDMNQHEQRGALDS